MNAALHSARHDARLLSNHLKRSFGKGNELLSESEARNATTFLLAQADTHGDLDTEKALRLSRLTPPPATARSTSQDATGNAMDVEGGGNTDAAVGTVGGETLQSSHGGQLDSALAAPSHEMVGRSEGKPHSAVANTTLKGGCEPGSADSVVDRQRLIALLAAEERISAMASHLGSADPMTHLRSLLLPEQALSGTWSSRSAAEVPWVHQSSQLRGMGSLSVVLGESSAANETLANATATATHPTGNGTDGLPHLSGDPHSSGGKGKPAQRKKRRSRSAENFLLSSGKSEPWDDSVAEESTHSRKKRNREVEVAGHSPEVEGLGWAGLSLADVPQSGLARSSSFTTSHPEEMTMPEAGVTGSSSYCSLPKLKASRISW